MPTYDYVCTVCGHEYELFQKMSDEPKKRCPKCRSKVERKIGTGAGLIFKGSGFYITDYRSDDYKKKVKAEGPSGDSSNSSSGESGSASKSDSSNSSSGESGSASKGASSDSASTSSAKAKGPGKSGGTKPAKKK